MVLSRRSWEHTTTCVCGRMNRNTAAPPQGIRVFRRGGEARPGGDHAELIGQRVPAEEGVEGWTKGWGDGEEISGTRCARTLVRWTARKQVRRRTNNSRNKRRAPGFVPTPAAAGSAKSPAFAPGRTNTLRKKLYKRVRRKHLRGFFFSKSRQILARPPPA